MTDKTGRTFWDWMAEDDMNSVYVVIVIILIIGAVVEVFG